MSDIPPREDREITTPVTETVLAPAPRGDGAVDASPELRTALEDLDLVPGLDPGVTQEITLAQIFPKLVEHGVMTEDDRFLFSLVLDRAADDNLRHDVAHGLIRVPACTDERVARVLQLYAIVAGWRLPIGPYPRR